jgi:hypothetical protein
LTRGLRLRCEGLLPSELVVCFAGCFDGPACDAFDVCAPADTGCGLIKVWNRSNSALHKTPASASRKELKMGLFFHG